MRRRRRPVRRRELHRHVPGHAAPAQPTPGGAETIACTDFGDDVADGEMYFKLVEDDFLDDPNLLVMNPCMDDPAVCDDFGFVHFEAHGDHLQEDGWSTQSNPGCALYAIRNYAVMLDASTLRVETKEWYGTEDSNNCPLDHAEALLDTPDCERNEAWEATRL